LAHSTDAVEDRLQLYRGRKPPAQPPRVLLTAKNLNPAERQLQATVMITQSGPRTGFVSTNGDRDFADKDLRVTFHNVLYGDVTIPCPLAQVVDPASTAGSSQVTVSIPANVDPSQFPDDTYSFDLRVSVHLPRDVQVAGRDELTDADDLGIWNYWAFVYAVSLMPAVIGLSFFIRTRRRGTSDTSAAMELAAALLALIALRQVFVPTPPKPKPRKQRRRLTPSVPDGAVREIARSGRR
jgi:hypothetical protein